MAVRFARKAKDNWLLNVLDIYEDVGHVDDDDDVLTVHTLIVNFNPTSTQHILIKAIFDAFVNLNTNIIIFHSSSYTKPHNSTHTHTQ